ncbi:MAG: hypothetical protein AB4042_06660 [Leptolyngbyaceae cyanobacterium]
MLATIMAIASPPQYLSSKSSSPAPQHYAVLEEVVNAIALGQGTEDMTLLVVRCNYTQLGEIVLAELLEGLSGEDLQGGVYTLRLNCFPHDHRGLAAEEIVHQLQTITQEDTPGAVILLGLDAIHTPETLLKQLNKGREQLCRQFAFPVLLWVTDQGYGLLSQYANDLESISGGTTLLIQPTLSQLHQWLQDAAHRMFEALLAPHQPTSLEQRSQDWDSGMLQLHELAIALTELQANAYPIAPDLQASIAFTQGVQRHPQDSETLFQQSLSYWHDHPDVPNVSLKQGLALYYLGQVRCAIADNAEYQNPDWTAAVAPLDECLIRFRQSDRPDLVSLCSNQLAQVLHRLGCWDELEQLIHQVQPLHQLYSDAQALAQDYSFLAHIALHRHQWQPAIDLIQQALHALAQGNVTPNWRHLLYLKMLAEAKTALGDVPGAIQDLQAAQAMGSMDQPKLYGEVLYLLQRCLRNQGHYLEAFAMKQNRLLIEKQYGLRAFIGAGQLQCQPPDCQPPEPQPFCHRRHHPPLSQDIIGGDIPTGLYPQNKVDAILEAIAPEIAVSGRFQDLTELLERIAGKVHKLIVIHGISGVGKSSLVNSGLIPALQARALQNRTNVPVMIRQYSHWPQKLLDGLTTALGDGPGALQDVQAAHARGRMDQPTLYGEVW